MSKVKHDAKKAKPEDDTAPDVRRPSPGPLIPEPELLQLIEEVSAVKAKIEAYAAHLRPLDRRRLNGVGIRKQGFVERAWQLALENPEFLPHYLPTPKFGEDHRHFIDLRTLFDLNRQVDEVLWNLTMRAADTVYTDALEFYMSVREASKRRVDAAESLNEELKPFFRHKKREQGEPTAKQVRRDVDALLKGRRDGRVIVENVRPKVSGGTHKVIDEKIEE